LGGKNVDKHGKTEGKTENYPHSAPIGGRFKSRRMPE